MMLRQQVMKETCLCEGERYMYQAMMRETLIFCVREREREVSSGEGHVPVRGSTALGASVCFFPISHVNTRDFGFGSTHCVDVPCQMLLGFPAYADARDSNTSILSSDAS